MVRLGKEGYFRFPKGFSKSVCLKGLKQLIQSNFETYYERIEDLKDWVFALSDNFG